MTEPRIDTWDERLAALTLYTDYGSTYIRAVADNVATAKRMAAEKRFEEAEHWLSEAEEALRRSGGPWGAAS